MIRGDRRNEVRKTADRRRTTRTPGKMKYILDVTFTALRKLEKDREAIRKQEVANGVQ